LGPGESGKSTIFKQMKIIQDHGGFSRDELESYTQIVRSNCLSQMKVLIRAFLELGKVFSEQSAVLAEEVSSLSNTHAWSSELGEKLIALWSDPELKDLAAVAESKFGLNDTAEYFFDNLNRFLSDDYCPDNDDLIRARVRTTGIEEASFSFDGTVFTVVDVGGQRSERRKWLHCFDGVTAILFVAGLSGYDSTLREDDSQNRLIEAILLFDEIANSNHFADIHLILFLNKTDLFTDKLTRVPLSVCFPNYKAENDFESASAFVKARFLERTNNPTNVHFTCAINRDNVSFVLTSVQQTLLKKNNKTFVL